MSMTRLLTSILTRQTRKTISPSPQPPVAVTSDQKRFFEENGYLILEGFFEGSQIAKLGAHFDELWTNRPDRAVTIDIQNQNEQRLLFREVDEAAVRGLPYKLNDLHLFDSVVQNFALDPQLVFILTDLLSSTPVVCNTLLFERGSQQGAHFDTFFMPPKTPNKMCASWIAIDPVSEINGPLFYYPRSHLIEPFRFPNGGVRFIQVNCRQPQPILCESSKNTGLRKPNFIRSLGMCSSGMPSCCMAGAQSSTCKRRGNHR